MKTLSTTFITGLVLLGTTALSWSQLPVGSSSRNSAFTLFDENGALANHLLSQFEGKIVLAFYFTPW